LPNGKVDTYAYGYTRDTTCTVASHTWTERQFVVKSVAYAASQEQAFRTRLAQTCAQLDALLVAKQGKSRPKTLTALEATVTDIVTTAGLESVLHVTCHETVTTRTIRAYKDRPTRTVSVSTFSLTYQIDETMLAQVIDDFGWRVYATQAPPERLSLVQAVQEYRSEYRIEHSFSRLKGHSLSLHPMYLQRDDHRVGLVRVLSLALSLLSLLQYVVRRELTDTDQELTGLYGQITTNRPTSERLLQTFDNITLTIIRTEHETIRHVTPLTPVQTTILTLLDIHPDIYQFQQPI
jgi:transposase